LRTGEVFPRELDHHATIDRLSHDAIALLRAGTPIYETVSEAVTSCR
jgi:hypothetical protein